MTFPLCNGYRWGRAKIFTDGSLGAEVREHSSVELVDPTLPSPPSCYGPLITDGSLGAETAAMRSNYCSCDHSGIAIHSQSELCSRYGFLFNTPFS